jgi:DNA modification methylase
VDAIDLLTLKEAANTETPISGSTHDFYAYPARFSPVFASEAIKSFSRPGEIVLDPFMGGGTTVVEALIAGRRAIGVDINSLAVFVARVKTTRLSRSEIAAITSWVDQTVPFLRYDSSDHRAGIEDARTRNLDLPRARPIKKALGIALARIHDAQSPASRNFLRCLLLRCAQWALDNRRRTTKLAEFRERLTQQMELMILGNREFANAVRGFDSSRSCDLLQANATELERLPVFAAKENQVDLVVSSPPYPGIHVLYHRWQVDGRKESPAPYWIADCCDGQGAAYYTFGDRKADHLTEYFETLRAAFRSIRQVMKKGGHVVQMVSFNDRRRHLQRYLYAMATAGFVEIKATTAHRIWREVPNRKWHATLKGATSASREVVLVHRAG